MYGRAAWQRRRSARGDTLRAPSPTFCRPLFLDAFDTTLSSVRLSTFSAASTLPADTSRHLGALVLAAATVSSRLCEYTTGRTQLVLGCTESYLLPLRAWIERHNRLRVCQFQRNSELVEAVFDEMVANPTLSWRAMSTPIRVPFQMCDYQPKEDQGTRGLSASRHTRSALHSVCGLPAIQCFLNRISRDRFLVDNAISYPAPAPDRDALLALGPRFNTDQRTQTQPYRKPWVPGIIATSKLPQLSNMRLATAVLLALALAGVEFGALASPVVAKPTSKSVATKSSSTTTRKSTATPTPSKSVKFTSTSVKSTSTKGSASSSTKHATSTSSVKATSTKAPTSTKSTAKPASTTKAYSSSGKPTSSSTKHASSTSSGKATTTHKSSSTSVKATSTKPTTSTSTKAPTTKSTSILSTTSVVKTTPKATSLSTSTRKTTSSAKPTPTPEPDSDDEDPEDDIDDDDESEDDGETEDDGDLEDDSDADGAGDGSEGDEDTGDDGDDSSAGEDDSNEDGGNDSDEDGGNDNGDDVGDNEDAEDSNAEDDGDAEDN